MNKPTKKITNNLFATARKNQGETIGDQIDALAQAFTREADINALFILEQALAQATAAKSQETRIQEHDEMMIRFERDQAEWKKERAARIQA